MQSRQYLRNMPSYARANTIMKDRTTLSLRLRPEEREALEELKTYLNEPIASRALMTVIRLYPGQHQALQATLDELDRAKTDRHRLLQAIADAEQSRLGLINTAAEIAGEVSEYGHANPQIKIQ